MLETQIDTLYDRCLSPKQTLRECAAGSLDSLVEAQLEFGSHLLEFNTRTRNLFVSVLASDPNYDLRAFVSQKIADYWQGLSPSEAYQSFLSLPRSQRLADIRSGDPRLPPTIDLDLSIARFNQLTTILRAVQTLAKEPAANKHATTFFAHLKESGFAENLNQSRFGHLDYREFINNGYQMPKRPLLPSEIPTAFIKMCVTAVRRAGIFKAIVTRDFSIVGNEDILGQLEFEPLGKKLQINSLTGIYASLVAILKKLKPDPEAIKAASYLHKFENFFVQRK